MARMQAKGWPENGDYLRFDKLADPIIKAIRFAYSMRRKNKGKDIPWSGPGIGWRERATCFDNDEALRAEQLAYDEEDQGRDALDVIVGIALRLGIEQGRRIAAKDDYAGVNLRWMVHALATLPGEPAAILGQIASLTKEGEDDQA